jgi:hypothetical protein
MVSVMVVARLVIYVVLSTVGAMTVNGTHGLLLAVAAWVGLFVALSILDSIVVGSMNAGFWG